MRGKVVFRLTIVLLIGWLMVGCGRRLVGQPINEDNIPKIAVGRTTRDDILKLFGAPYEIEAKGDQEVLTYLHGTTFSWTAIVYTETQDKADILTVFIDQKGIVSNYVFSKGVSSPDIYRRSGPPRY
jgi:outer membrane protein assembly factor BamE (lipoprotein component of BamABCDE complex)